MFIPRHTLGLAAQGTLDRYLDLDSWSEFLDKLAQETKLKNELAKHRACFVNKPVKEKKMDTSSLASSLAADAASPTYFVVHVTGKLSVIASWRGGGDTASICNGGQIFITEAGAIAMAEKLAVQNPGNEYQVVRAVTSSLRPLAVTTRRL